jgi:hypothetical protein
MCEIQYFKRSQEHTEEVVGCGQVNGERPLVDLDAPGKLQDHGFVLVVVRRVGQAPVSLAWANREKTEFLTTVHARHLFPGFWNNRSLILDLKF